MGAPANWMRSGMDTETTSATYRRTQNPRVPKFSADLLEFQKTSNDYLMRPNPPAKLRKKCCPTAATPHGQKKKFICRETNWTSFLISGFSMAVPLFKIVALAFARNYLFHLFPLSDLFHEFFSGTLKPAKQISFGRNIGVHFPISRI